MIPTTIGVSPIRSDADCCCNLIGFKARRWHYAAAEQDTPKCCRSLELDNLNGTSSADSIRASGRQRRANRSHEGGELVN